MFGTKDLLDLLDRIPTWKRLGQVPDRVDQLEKRVADLEEKLGGKYPPDVCRSCGERALRLKEVMGGGTNEMWVCQSCNFHEERIVATSPTRRGPATFGRG
jgi:ribosomal protein L37AE/L43A